MNCSLITMEVLSTSTQQKVLSIDRLIDWFIFLILILFLISSMNDENT